MGAYTGATAHAAYLNIMGLYSGLIKQDKGISGKVRTKKLGGINFDTNEAAIEHARPKGSKRGNRLR